MSEISIPERHKYETITPFRLFVKSNFPFIENTYESLDNYGLYCKVVEYLNQVIAEQNKVNADMVTFTDFVTNYFENLDVQEEINNKLDQMTESGELQAILDPLVNVKFQNLSSEISSLNDKVNGIVNPTPIPVSSIGEMTNQSKIYVLTTNGHWYYYNTNTTSWTDGGVYQATAIADNSITPPKLNDILLNALIYKANGNLNIDLVNKQITSTPGDTFILAPNININISDILPFNFSLPSGNIFVLMFDVENKTFVFATPSSYLNMTNYLFLGFIYLVEINKSFINSTNCVLINNSPIFDLRNININSQTFLLDGTINISNSVNVETQDTETNVSFTNAIFSIGNGYINISMNSKIVNNLNRIIYCLYNLLDKTTRLEIVESVNFYGYSSYPNWKDGDVLLFTYWKEKESVYINYNAIDCNIYINGQLYNKNDLLNLNLPTKNKIVNCLGDSITQGVGATAPYTNTLSTVLELKTCNNYGISGSAIATRPSQPTHQNDGFCQRYDAMSDDADIIFVLGGTNDYWTNVQLGTIDSNDPETFYGALNTLCTGLINKYPNKTIIFGTPPKSWRTNGSFPNEQNSNGNTPEDFNKAIKEVCAKFTIPVLDLKHTLGIDPEIPVQFTNLTSDGVHYNNLGYKKLGNVISQFITNYYLPL